MKFKNADQLRMKSQSLAHFNYSERPFKKLENSECFSP